MRKPEGPADLNADTWAGCGNLWVFADFLLAPPAGVYPADATDESLDRRLRLLLVAALRAVWHHLPDPRSRAAVEASERYADDRDSSAVDAAWGPAEAAMEEADEAAIANGDA